MKQFFTLLFLLAGQRAIAQITAADFAKSTIRYRDHYKQEFLEDARSPLSAADTAFLDFFPPTLAYRLPARIDYTPDAQPFELPTYSGQKRDYRQFGIIHFEVSGKKYDLNIYQNLRLMKDSAYQDYLFLPFKDLTNNESTYGGGRYLEFRLGDIRPDQTLILDFNKCYNPWCAYSDGYNCPIPPISNHLDLEIRAGERIFKGVKKH